MLTKHCLWDRVFLLLPRAEGDATLGGNHCRLERPRERGQIIQNSEFKRLRRFIHHELSQAKQLMPVSLPRTAVGTISRHQGFL